MQMHSGCTNLVFDTKKENIIELNFIEKHEKNYREIGMNDLITPHCINPFYLQF